MEQHLLGVRSQQVGSMMGVVASYHGQTLTHFLALGNEGTEFSVFL